MGKTKDFSSNALATLTGKPKLPGTQVENKVQTVKQVQEEPAVKQAVVDIPAEAAEKALAKTSAPKSVPQVKKEGSAKGKKKVVKANLLAAKVRWIRISGARGLRILKSPFI